MPIRTVADVEALEAQPLAERALPRSTYEALAATASRTPDARALSFFLTADTYQRAFTWRYDELLADITRAANAFHALGVDAEHPVAFVLPNLPETHFTIWGGEAAGVVFAINPLLEARHIAELLRAARVRVLVTLAPAPGIDLWPNLAPYLRTLDDLRVVAQVDLAAYIEGAATPSRGGEPIPTADGFKIIDFREAMQEQPSDHLVAARALSQSSISSYVCTGGTTGSPKIAVRTHGNEVFDAWAVGQIIDGGASQRTFFCGLPLFHVNAQLITGLLPWMQGHHVVLGTPEGYRGKDVIARFWEIASHYRISMFSGVPTLYAALVDLPVGDKDISSLELGLCGAAPMPAKLIENFEAHTGIKILEGYGLTEGTCVSAVNLPDGERHAGSIGVRIPYQQMRAVILDDAGQLLRTAAIGEIGAIVIKGPNVFSGYLDTRQNKGLWLDIEGDTWLNTGDLGRQDERGWFWLSGRRKELIIRGGHNIDPRMIEDVLLKHPSVAMAAAVGSPDSYTGEVPVAYVQTKPGTPVTEQELLCFAATEIPERAAVPKRVNITASLPVTGVGKIFKPALQQLELESVVRAEAVRAGATIADLAHDRDGQGANVLRIRTHGNAAALQRALDRYAFKSEVLECDDAGLRQSSGMAGMTSGAAAVCLGPDSPGGFMVRQFTRRRPAADEIEVAMAATSVNPIDVRRAEGYGRRLMSLLGAGKFPLVLGNDLAGTVTAVGSRVSSFKVGDLVYGVKPASAEGTHASHVLLKAAHALPAPEGRDLHALAAIPYSFVTMWLAVRGAGLTPENASGKKVLVHGAAGGLGTLATQMLSTWGAKVTAIARQSNSELCLMAGAAEVVDWTTRPFASLARSFDGTLNFATWDDDLALLGCLRENALGHATTVHPMLANFDRLGWVRGALKTVSDKRGYRRALPKGARNYAWTLFKPEKGALADLGKLVEMNHVSLPIGLRKPLTEAAEAFDHVRRGQPGRALLLP